MFTFFSTPLLCLKQDDFKITQTDEKKIVKIVSKLVWFKKSLLVLRYLPPHDFGQLFVLEFVRSAVLSLTDYLKQKSILHKPRCLLYLLHFNFL